MSDRRILGFKDGTLAPLFGDAAAGQRSPSPTMPVETVALPRLDWQSHAIAEQMITLFLQPAIALHSETGGPTRKLAIPARSVAFSLRAKEEHLRWETSVKFMSLTIDDAVLARASDALCRGGRFELMASPDVRNDQLASLLYSLYRESSDGYPAGRLYTDGIEQSLAALLATRHNALARPAARGPALLPPAAARRLVDYMHAHLGDTLTLAELAVHTGYSESHFGRLFKASFGIPAHHYLMGLRIDKAKELLRSTRHFSMLDIALMVGFANAQHFSRVFLKFAGMTPSAFKRSLGGGNGHVRLD